MIIVQDPAWIAENVVGGVHPLKRSIRSPSNRCTLHESHERKRPIAHWVLHPPFERQPRRRQTNGDGLIDHYDFGMWLSNDILWKTHRLFAPSMHGLVHVGLARFAQEPDPDIHSVRVIEREWNGQRRRAESPSGKAGAMWRRATVIWGACPCSPSSGVLSASLDIHGH